MQMRQRAAAHHEQARREHDDADDQVEDLVEPLEGEPMRQAQIGKFARQSLLRRECQRERHRSAEAAAGGIAADGVAEGDRPGVLVGSDAVDEAEQERGQQIDGQGDVDRLPQIDGAHHADWPPSPSAERQSRQTPFRTIWWS